MMNFDIKKSCRKCCESETEIQPGEEFYSALIEVNETTTQRLDYRAEHWSGPPENCLGWWKSRIPEQGKGRVYWAPKKVLIAYFEHAVGNPATIDIAYVTALLLAQKKYLSIGDSDDPSLLIMEDRYAKSTYEIEVPEITPQRMHEIQDELAGRLFMDEPVDDEADEQANDDA